MPRLSLYKPEKGKDYKFIDRQASEMFTVGGTDVYWHKYLGANTTADNATAATPNYANTSVTNIQDLLFLENRDRTYDKEIYRIRGLYNVQNIDFNVSQFGLFIENDTVYMTVHINDIQKILGRKPITGDVLELPHLRDDFALNNYNVSLPRYYQVTDVGRASEGFSATWMPHLYRLKLKKVANQQQFTSIFNAPLADSNGDPIVGANSTLAELLSNYNTVLNVGNQVVAQGQADAPKSGYETRQFYTLAVDPATGKPVVQTADESSLDASQINYLANENAGVPVRTGYTGYLIGDGYPVNGYAFGFGVQFPDNPGENDFYLRTDFLPNRLFRFEGNSWIKVEDAVRMDMTQTDARSTLKTSFINNNNYTYNSEVATDVVNLTINATVINTRILFATGSVAKYAVVKIGGTTTLGFALSDYPTTLYTSYNYTSPVGTVSACLRINLPTINGVQQVIPTTGQWSVTLYNTREAERSSLSTALRPKADF